jgi:hypothetical protein
VTPTSAGLAKFQWGRASRAVLSVSLIDAGAEGRPCARRLTFLPRVKKAGRRAGPREDMHSPRLLFLVGYRDSHTFTVFIAVAASSWVL